MNEREGNNDIFLLSMGIYGATERMKRTLEGITTGNADDDDLNDALNDYNRFMDHWFTLPNSTHRAVGKTLGIPDDCLPTRDSDWTPLIEQARIIARETSGSDTTENELQQTDIRAADALMAAAEMRVEFGWNYLAGERFEKAGTIYIEIAETEEVYPLGMKAGHAYLKAAYAYLDAGTSSGAMDAEKTFREAREHFDMVSSNMEKTNPDLAAEAAKLSAEATKLAREAYMKGLDSGSKSGASTRSET